MKRWLIGILIVLMAGCASGSVFPLLIPPSLPPDEDCSNFQQRVNDLKHMSDLYVTKVGDKYIFDEEAARTHGFPEKSIVLTREMTMWKEWSLRDDYPTLTPHVQWLKNCATQETNA